MKTTHLSLCLILTLFALPAPLLANSHVKGFSHPIKNGATYTTTSHCPNCGMNVNMWARTRHQFNLEGNSYETCSLRCMADLVDKAGTTATAIKTAVYFEPETMGDTLQGWYVIGSQASGTMTMKSKIFFDSKKKAEQFNTRHGGTLYSFDTALAMAIKELQPMRPKLEMKRLKKGKIAKPEANASCGNCGMRPAQFPKFRSQMHFKDGKTVHFCSTKCLIKQKEMAKEGGASWVTVYPDGDTDFAEGLYYVIGSDIMGPMGPDALPFRRKHDATTFIAEHGGMVKTYTELQPGLFGGMMQHTRH